MQTLDSTSTRPAAGAASWGRRLLLAGLAAAAVVALTLRPSCDWPEFLTPRRLGAAGLAAAALALTLVVWRRVRRRTVVAALGVLLLLTAGAAAARTYFRYHTADTTDINVLEYGNDEYPEDPAERSVHHGQYNGRRLVLVKKDATHFDFVFEPQHPHVARVTFRDVDVSLMTPGLPAWAQDDDGLRRVALTDRQWNRQQVAFGGPKSPHVELSGGDGFERERLVSAELAKNCLNAGLWEVLLFTEEHGDKVLYYQGWFTFPLGHYRDLFEQNTGLPYARHWHYLEHWIDPAGTPVPLEKLRRVTREREAAATFDRAEAVISSGEQVRKRRTTVAEDVVTWGDFYDGRPLCFASFVPPGRYSLRQPWHNGYRRMDRFDKAVWRDVVSPAGDRPLSELELVFSGSAGSGLSRFVVSGFDFGALPQLPVKDYPKGLYMPMGVGTPPFFQGYEQLVRNPPEKSPYFCLQLDERGRWVDHHSFAVDGPVLHRDENDPDRLHVYLLSYERHSLIAHVTVDVPR